MDLQKLNVKFFVAPDNTVPLTDFIDIFHGWIQATDGVYHDVADYSHMQAGPGIVLVANDANVGIDESGGRRGSHYALAARLHSGRKVRSPVLVGKEQTRAVQAEITRRLGLTRSGAG